MSEFKPTPMKMDSDGNVFYSDGLTLGAQSNTCDSHVRRLQFAEFTVRACNMHDVLVEALRAMMDADRKQEDDPTAIDYARRKAIAALQGAADKAIRAVISQEEKA